MQRSYIKYTSINAILSDIHSMIDSIDWDEGRMLEWATKGLRKINLPAKYEDVVTFVSVQDHVGMLPKDIKYINQMFYKLSDSSVTDEELIQLINEQLGITEEDKGKLFAWIRYQCAFSYREGFDNGQDELKYAINDLLTPTR